ncbi:MAG: sigma 54-interacting transcriptional regulator, partial [Bacteroidetes bacterium]|nr:sigma 54-interacting transcriptional regulator [Bacteroidota bacterium]
EMALSIQVKLLRVLERMTFRRVGGTEDIDVSVRIISATNRDLAKQVRAGEFREDLYFRLKVVPVELPPLRERPEDLPELVSHFLREFSTAFGKRFGGVDDGALRAMRAYPWPGNIRELQHAIERAVIMADGPQLSAVDFSLNQPLGANNVRPKTLNLEEMEKHAIMQAIKSCNGNYTQAAKELGFGRSTLYRKMELYGIE